MTKAKETSFEELMAQWEYILSLPASQQPRTVPPYLRSKREYPAIYAEVAELCHKAQERGYEKWSINGAFEILRWQRPDLTTGDLGLKVNNTYRAYAARDLMLEHPALRGFLRIRVLKPNADNWGHIS